VNGTGTKAASLAVCGLAHAIIDALCAGILFTLCQRQALPLPEVGATFLLYNLLAFGAQPLLGVAVDRSGQPRLAALVGGVLVAGAAMTFGRWPLAALLASGCGCG
jgi:hypothetical protein